MGSSLKNQLVLIEWLDSTQPIGGWQLVGDVKGAIVKIASVGWLAKDGKLVKVLAPNVGGLSGQGSPQVSGVISIPTCAVVAIYRLVEEGGKDAARL